MLGLILLLSASFAVAAAGAFYGNAVAAGVGTKSYLGVFVLMVLLA